MGSKSTAQTASSPVNSGNRRASGRLRKPTAKAQVLDGGRLHSPPLSDTIVVSSPPAPKHRSLPRESSTTPGPAKEPPREASPEPQIPETPATRQVNGTTPPSKTEDAKDEAEIPPAESPRRRVSQRERKPTAKVLSTSPTAQKRPAASVDDQEDPPRKSARISYGGAKVPSKLRYSVSSTRDEEPDEPEQVEIAETPQGKRSKVVVLKTTPTKADGTPDADVPEGPVQEQSKVVVLKSKRLSEITDPTQHREEPSSNATRLKAPKRRSRRAPRTEQTAADNTVPAPEQPQPLATCNLSCLPPWSRLLAFAEIAKQMPDSDDDDETVVPGSAQDWRSYTKNWCQCSIVPELPIHDTNPSELARALLPNTVSQGTKADPIELTEPAIAETELLSQPVNTIIRATDAERLSQLFAGPNRAEGEQRRYNTPATGRLRSSIGFMTPASDGLIQRRGSTSQTANSLSRQVATSSEPPKRTYEERLRDDHKALADIRKRASARGIRWSFNMTFDDIHALVTEAEEDENDWYYDQHMERMADRARAMGHQVGENNGSPGAFGVQIPGRVPDIPSSFYQMQHQHQQQHVQQVRQQVAQEVEEERRQQKQSKSNRKRHKDNWINYSTSSIPANGTTPEASQRLASPNAVSLSFAENYDPTAAAAATTSTSQASRRLSSPSRPKSSRFKVDPRGLLGESPGPGTIINIDERKNGGGRPSRRSRGSRAEGSDHSTTSTQQLNHAGRSPSHAAGPPAMSETTSTRGQDGQRPAPRKYDKRVQDLLSNGLSGPEPVTIQGYLERLFGPY